VVPSGFMVFIMDIAAMADFFRLFVITALTTQLLRTDGVIIHSWEIRHEIGLADNA
jgi:hypothetical protein